MVPKHRRHHAQRLPDKASLRSAANPQNVSLTGWLFHDKPSNVQEWNLQFQHQLDAKTAMTLATWGRSLPTSSPFLTTCNCLCLITRPQPIRSLGLGTVPVNDTSGYSFYHGMHAVIATASGARTSIHRSIHVVACNRRYAGWVRL